MDCFCCTAARSKSILERSAFQICIRADPYSPCALVLIVIHISPTLLQPERMMTLDSKRLLSQLVYIGKDERGGITSGRIEGEFSVELCAPTMAGAHN